VDQACGIVFRYRDANNYYITRANALEGNISAFPCLLNATLSGMSNLAASAGSITTGVTAPLVVCTRTKADAPRTEKPGSNT